MEGPGHLPKTRGGRVSADLRGLSDSVNAHLNMSPFQTMRTLSRVLAALMVLFQASRTEAGDLLRGGAGPARATPGTPALQSPAITEQAASRRNAQDALARTSRTIAAAKSFQEAARQAARASQARNLGADPNHPGQNLPDVTDGLGTGGLEVVPGAVAGSALWRGADLPVESGAGSARNVRIRQTQQTALLNWKTFNVGSRTTVTFDQTAGGRNAGGWIAFNKIQDPSGRPSQILGSLQAEGQVYVINGNGIVFGGGSQVNAHALVASALPINDNLVSRGLLNNPDAQFLFTGLAVPAGANGTPAFTPAASNLAGGRWGDVTVQAGAQLKSPANASNVGGRIALIGANVRNEGSLATPSGQTILAAGLQVGVAAHPSGDPSLRGLDVYVGAVEDPGSGLGMYAGNTRNLGIIEAPRGNVYLTGRSISHRGVIDSSTTVALNGRVDLDASYDAVPNTAYRPTERPTDLPFLFRRTGSIELGDGSVIRVAPEFNDPSKVAGTALALRSQVNLRGLTAYLGQNSVIFAPNGTVTAEAGTWDRVQTASLGTNRFVRSGGQVYLDRDSLIHVAGTVDAKAYLRDYLLTVQLRGAELAGSPLQRDSIFRNASGTAPAITVDLRRSGVVDGFYWVGTPVADLSGYLAIIQRDVSQLTVDGGTVSLRAGSSVVMQPGARVDVSAGWLNFDGGLVKTTRVLRNGTLRDIADVFPDRRYNSFFTGEFTVAHPRWGVRETYQAPWVTGARYEAPYVSGAAGGKLEIAAAGMALDGTILGRTIAGPRQQRSGVDGSASFLPKPSEFSLSLTAEQFLTGIYPVISPTPADVRFDGAASRPADPFLLDGNGIPAALRADRLASISLSPDLFVREGFGNVSVKSPDGGITVPEGVRINAPAGSSLTLKGANIDVSGSLHAPGGSFAATAYNISPAVADANLRDPFAPSPPANVGRGLFRLGPGASIDVAGNLVNDRGFFRSVAGIDPLMTDGGSISIQAFAVRLEKDSLLDVSGGARLFMEELELGEYETAVRYGQGGVLRILSGQDPGLKNVTGGALQLAGVLKGYSGARGGELSLQASLVQIGGQGAPAGALQLDPAFFTRGGFARYAITGIGRATTVPEVYTPGVLVASGTIVRPRTLSSMAVGKPDGRVEMRLVQQPVGVRSPASLVLQASGAAGKEGLEVRGGVVMEAGSRIQTDPLGAVSLKGHTVAVLGGIFAPGGEIEIEGARDSQEILFSDITKALTTVFIGAHGVVSAKGTTVLQPDAFGRRIGQVVPGGNIRVSGNVVASAGSLLDVSGTSGRLDYHPAALDPSRRLAPGLTSGLSTLPEALRVERTRVDGNGGRIELHGGQMLFADGTLLGRAGGSLALGGFLEIESKRFYPPNVIPPVTDSTLVVTQQGATIPSPLPDQPSSIGQGFDGVIGRGYFAVDAFQRGGFDSLALNGSVEFQGPVRIAGKGMIRVADGGILTANDEVRLASAYVFLGKAFLPPVLPEQRPGQIPFSNVAPLGGTGRLSVEARNIDLGTLSFQGVSGARLEANGGNLRGNGIVGIAGEVVMRAAQVYPTTFSEFSVFSYDRGSGASLLPGKIRIEQAGHRQLPLSAAGTLSLYAREIEQFGTLRAPMGIINLGWDGTGPAPRDPIAGNTRTLSATQSLTLGAGSTTSVSGVDPVTGRGIVVPFGESDGTSWLDPRGFDISGGGLPEKAVNVGAESLVAQTGSLIDLRGGGELYAFEWKTGNGGQTDLLGKAAGEWTATTTYGSGDLVTYEGQTYSARAASQGITPSPSVYWTRVPESYAILPGYSLDLAPYSPFGGYSDDHIGAGDRIFLGATPQNRAGTYTLLPARYAQLPGGLLVTPRSGNVTGSLRLVTGASFASGYRLTDLSGGREVAPLSKRYEVAPGEVVRARAEYADLSADSFLTSSAVRLNAAVPKLPGDAGYLLLQSSKSMAVQGDVLSASISGGRGASIDIATPQQIVITGDGGTAPPDAVQLNANVLTRFGAESLVIGGKRGVGPGGVTLQAQAAFVALDNAGAPLTAPDLTLVSGGGISVGGSAEMVAGGGTSRAGSFQVAGSGALLRVSQDETANVLRSQVVPGGTASLGIGAGAVLSGGSVILDSTDSMQVDASATLRAESYSFSSGRISVELIPAVALQPSPGLVLSGGFVDGLSGATALSLLSYSSIDLYGSGILGGNLRTLSLNSGSIRGFGQAGGSVGIGAENLLLGNRANSVAPVPQEGGTGTLDLSGSRIVLTGGSLALDQFLTASFAASDVITSSGNGTLSVAGGLNLSTPLLTGEAGSNRTISASGPMQMVSPGTAAGESGGLGATLSLAGQNLTVQTNVRLPSGALTLRSTSGDLNVGGSLLVTGTVQSFFDVNRYTNGGQIQLRADAGDVILAPGSVIDVSAPSRGGHAGALSISANQGTLTTNGLLSGRGGVGGLQGTFSLDLRSLSATDALGLTLSAAHFTESQSIRVRTGNVTVGGTLTAHQFQLSADQGAIAVSGTIDASGATAGRIALASHGDLTLLSGARLTVKGETFDGAGKGGSVTLESGTQRNGVAGPGRVDIQPGSTIDLSVTSKVPGDAATPGSSAFQGQFSGKLHIRAPRNGANTDLQVAAIGGTVVDPSSVLVEGYRIYNLTAGGGNIGAAEQSSMQNDALAFLGAAGSATPHFTAMRNRLLSLNLGLEAVTVLAPGVEVLNTAGDLSLGAASANTTSDWNLASSRYGPKGAPGVLTMRASGNMNFHNALSDGFTPTLSPTDPSWLWLARLTNSNPLLPENTQSWSYRITAGADLGAADFRQVRPLSDLAPVSGNVRLGKETGAMSAPGGSNAVTSSVIGATGNSGGRGLYQVIRTGSGDIEINAARSVQWLNQFAAIYTAGTRVADASMGGTFDPFPLSQVGGAGVLGADQQNYPALYSVAGGNLSIRARQDLERSGASSSRQLPNNWLYRRGAVDPVTGEFTTTGFGTGIASTTWWIDFSNFFQGAGALGGGNVSLEAGRNITNVDAVVPTNARMTKGTPGNPLAADQRMVELGGGDLRVRAGNHIDAGVYYVERGRAVLDAGGRILTNATRSPGTFNPSTGANSVLPETSWLPTTLFLGKGGIDVTARGDVLLGPVGNPFLLPVGLGNSFWNKTYFSTYAPDSRIEVSSLGGTLSLRQGAYVNNVFMPLLEAWSQSQQLLGSGAAANAQPWLRLAETATIPFRSVAGLLPGTVRATAFSGDILLTGNLTLAPAPAGTLELVTRGGIKGLQPTGFNSNENRTAWVSSRLTVSDADPRVVPRAVTPLSYQSLVGTSPSQAVSTQTNFLLTVDQLFRETGAILGTQASQQVKQTLHSPGPLHVQDPDPVRLYADTSDVTGVTLFSPKPARVLAGRDITDVALYLQNLKPDAVSVVSSARDLVPYNPNSALRVAAKTGNNFVVEGFFQAGAGPLAGDIQIGGPGTLEVLAGRNLDLGTAVATADGTAAGITSIGNTRNPFLPFEGADLVTGAGLGRTLGLGQSGVDWDAFLNSVLEAEGGAAYLSELSLPGGAAGLTLAGIRQLGPEARSQVALQLFYLVLRKSGRDRNLPGSPSFGTFADGFRAIDRLFGQATREGDILTRERNIRTKSGGNISILTPGGGLSLAQSVARDALIPPGVITEAGGSIRMFTEADVNLGVSRIFTLRGGDILIWSTNGDIAAGASSKTVQSAPPTRVLIDPTSADVTTDLAGTGHRRRHWGVGHGGRSAPRQCRFDCSQWGGGCGRRRNPGHGKPQHFRSLGLQCEQHQCRRDQQRDARGVGEFRAERLRPGGRFQRGRRRCVRSGLRNAGPARHQKTGGDDGGPQHRHGRGSRLRRAGCRPPARRRKRRVETRRRSVKQPAEVAGR